MCHGLTALSATLSPVPTDPSEALRNVGAMEGAEDRAFRRGQAAAQMKGQLEAHEARLNRINGSIDRSARSQAELASEVSSLRASIEKSAAIATARAEDVKLAAEKQVSTRTFVFGLVGAVTAIGTLLAATGHV